MKTIFLNILVMLTITIVSGMAGCGGGGSSSSSPNPGTTPTASQTVSGVAATGAPISGTIYLKDSSNPAVVKNTTTNADGSFSFDVTGLTAPFMLKAVGTSSGQNYTLYSVAGAPGVANINPLSHLAVVKANGGVDPAALYNNLTREQAQAIKTALETVIPQIQAMLLQVLSQYGVTTTHFIKDAYTANHMGLDLLLDMIDIVVNNGILTMTNKVSGATILTTTLTGNTLNGQVVTANIPTVPTQTAGTVYVYPASATLSTSGTAKFKSFVIGSMNQSVTWSVVETGGGSITSAGIYTAPATAGTYHVKATSVADSSKSATATVLVYNTNSVTFDMSGVWKGTIDELNYLNNVIAGTTQNVDVTLDSSLVGTIVSDKGLSARIYFANLSGYWFCSIDNPITWGTMITPPTYKTIYSQSGFASTTSMQQSFESNANAPIAMQYIILVDSYDVTMNGTTYRAGGSKEYKLTLSR